MFLCPELVFIGNFHWATDIIRSFAAAKLRSENVGDDQLSEAAVNSEARVIHTGGQRHLNTGADAGFKFDQDRISVIAGYFLSFTFLHERGQIRDQTLRFAQNPAKRVHDMQAETPEKSSPFPFFRPPVE